MKTFPTPVEGALRRVTLKVPECIRYCSGILVFGKRIKSLVFTTDVSIIRNVNADAVIAVYPFTPQPIITQALMLAADIPVFVGVGGGLTQGPRVVNLAMFAEMQGAMGVVVTVARADEDFEGRMEAGASIFNVSAAARTPEVVRTIRERFPHVPIIATGGAHEDSIRRTIEAGANAITWTPPSCGEIFKDIMTAYREGRGYDSVHRD